ncbi:hypothetical protein F4604DRAFT_2039688 [Suillus subluteus]|nr:hypothetical protein F4604DRAFT_2039688 [Suillus subluteus]
MLQLRTQLLYNIHMFNSCYPLPHTTASPFLMSKCDQIFWAATTIALAVSLLQGAITALVKISEREGSWTIRFSLARREHLWWAAIALALVASFGCMVLSFLVGKRLLPLSCPSASSLAVFRYAWPAWRNRHYCSNRWAAWTGPSRTGIHASLVPLIEGNDPWPILSKNIPVMRRHPVDIHLPIFKSNLIIDDVTDILKAKKRLVTEKQPDEKSKTPKKLLVPDDKTGLYAPIHPEKSASLLWGSHIGFTPRVSRGILAVPQRLLRPPPFTSSGHDGQPVCLAHGILARNKGLEPHTFILGLNPGTLEEKCVQWPRPSKVLRTYYREEMNAAYGGLGPIFVDVATELALLLADSSHSLIEDWLSLRMEHQDLVLNNQLARLGASDEELKVLYRLSYAAMLVSLSAHRKGRKWRPEIKLFTAYWKKCKGEVPAWMGEAAVVERIGKEESGAGDTDLDALIEAVLCKIDTPRSV